MNGAGRGRVIARVRVHYSSGEQEGGSMRAHINFSREVMHNAGLEYCDVVMYRVKGRRKERRSLGTDAPRKHQHF